MCYPTKNLSNIIAERCFKKVFEWEKNIQRYTLGFSKIETTNYDERFQQRGFFLLGHIFRRKIVRMALQDQFFKKANRTLGWTYKLVPFMKIHFKYKDIPT